MSNLHLPPGSTIVAYPSLLKRYQSNFIDRMVSYACIGLFLWGANSIAPDNLPLKLAAIFAAMSYEPLVMAANRRTLGQLVTGIKVQQLSLNERLPLLNSFARFWIRMLLGWTTYITIHSNDERRALHDIVTDSVSVLC